MTMIAPAIVIAAGGAGRRMGGGKPLRPLAGHSLLDRAIAMAYVPTPLAAEGTDVEVDFAGKAASAKVAKLPFVSNV